MGGIFFLLPTQLFFFFFFSVAGWGGGRRNEWGLEREAGARRRVGWEGVIASATHPQVLLLQGVVPAVAGQKGHPALLCEAELPRGE
jgi:hypothetical protein